MSDGTRTRDIRDHNATLCQLSYTHHASWITQEPYRPRADSGNIIAIALPPCETGLTYHGRMSLAARWLDLNSDVGERLTDPGIADDAVLMTHISSANIACGGHAGTRESMRRLCELAARHQVAIGAQVSYVDVEGFGRRVLQIPTDTLTQQLADQLGQLAEAASEVDRQVDYLRPHGALYNQALVDESTAHAVVAATPSAMPVLCLPNTALAGVAASAGHRVVAEIFADRALTDVGLLAARAEPGAVISEPTAISERLSRWVQHGVIESTSGQHHRIPADSICIHSDTAGASTTAQLIRSMLASHGVEVRSFVRPSLTG